METRNSETASLLQQTSFPPINSAKQSLFSSIRRVQESNNFLFFTISLCTLTDNLIYGLVLPILPSSLRDRAHVPEQQLQRWIWITLATFGVGQILCTALAALAVNHLASPIRVLFGSLICLMGAILFYGVANSPWLIISARFAQGASNAIINTVGLMILVDRLGPENYGKSFGYIGMATAIGCVLGPVFGGVLHDLSGYEAMFMITAGLVGFCALLVMLTHDVSKYAIERNSSPCSEETPRSPETDRERPLLGSTEPERWPISQLLLGLLGLVLSSLFPASLDTILPLHAQNLFRWTTLQTGLIFLAFIPGSLFGPYFGTMIQGVGAKALLVFACVMSALAMAIISFASENESVDVLLVVCACLIGGLSEPVFFAVSGSWVADIFEDKLQDTYSAKARVMWASVIVNYAATAGAVIGPVVAGNFHDYLGWGETTRILSVVFWISGVVFWLFT